MHSLNNLSFQGLLKFIYVLLWEGRGNEQKKKIKMTYFAWEYLDQYFFGLEKVLIMSTPTVFQIPVNGPPACSASYYTSLYSVCRQVRRFHNSNTATLTLFTLHPFCNMPGKQNGLQEVIVPCQEIVWHITARKTTYCCLHTSVFHFN